MPRPAIFLDRDGTITREVDYLRAVKDLRLLPGAASAVRTLNEAGFAVVVVTNQSGIARGLLTEKQFHEIHAALVQRLARHRARLDGMYYCPHHPQATVARYRQECECRKPAPGLLRQAARELDLDLTHSYAIGDRARDLAPGRAVGCRTVLVRSGYGAEQEANWGETWRPDQVTKDLRAAAEWVLKQEVRHALQTLTTPETELPKLIQDPCEQP